MGAGEFRERIDFLRPTVAYDEYNEPLEKTWANAFTLPARLMDEAGREFATARKRNSETSILFKIRYTEKIRENMRVKFCGVEYNIVHISPSNGKKRERLISCKDVD